MELDASHSGSSREALEAAKNSVGAIPKTQKHSNPNKIWGKVGMMQLNFTTKKDKEEVTQDETVKKSKKEKKRSSIVSITSDVDTNGDVVRRSSIASTLTRKMSFGKMKIKPGMSTTSSYNPMPVMDDSVGSVVSKKSTICETEPSDGSSMSNLTTKKDKEEATRDETAKKKSKKSTKDKKRSSSYVSITSDVDTNGEVVRRSSIASTLARKMSFGKLKTKPGTSTTSSYNYMPVMDDSVGSLVSNNSTICETEPSDGSSVANNTTEPYDGDGSSVSNLVNESHERSSYVTVPTDGTSVSNNVTERNEESSVSNNAMLSELEQSMRAETDENDGSPGISAEGATSLKPYYAIPTAGLPVDITRPTSKVEAAFDFDQAASVMAQQSTNTKHQILAITTPLMEKQDQGEGEDVTAITPPTASSSKSDVFFTPRDSPSPPPITISADASCSPPDDAFTTPDAGAEDPTDPEDVMAGARARLSHSLGVPSTPASPTSMGDKREHLYKILVIGELGTGKTSIIKRYVHQFFSQHYRATIGVDFALKVLNWDASTIIRLQLWDIAGQERFGNMTRVYYKEAVGAFIVFDVTRAATFDAVVKWKQDLDSKVQLPDGSPIPCVLLANKCDQQKEGLVNNPGKMDEYCKERGFSGWFETSAKENINIEDAARSLVTKILENDVLGVQGESGMKDGERFNLDGQRSIADEQTKSKCSC